MSVSSPGRRSRPGAFWNKSVKTSLVWNSIEIALRDALASRLVADTRSRCAVVEKKRLTLRLSDAFRFRANLPPPPNPGALFVRHLLHTIGLDETRLLQWRIEHKLVQALLIDRFCHGAVPITSGVSRALAGMSRTDARRRLEDLRDQGTIAKSALGEAGGELGRTDRIDDVLAALDADALAPPSPDTLSDERYILQERLWIAREYRVHSLEDRVIPDLTFHRYAPHETSVHERHAPNAFVASVLDRLPNALVKDSMYAWDVAVDEEQRWHVIEWNPAGVHPVYKAGFHCSGFFQAAPWGPSAIAELLRFVCRHRDLEAEIALDADDASDVASTYWWVARGKELRDLTETLANGSAHDWQRNLVSHAVARRPSAEQQLFAWALRALRERHVHADDTPSGTNAASLEVAPAASIGPPATVTAADADVYRLREWSGIRYSHLSDEPVHALFQRQVRQRPDAVAIVSGDVHLRYRDLDQHANGLAVRLRALGVGPDTRVGVCMGRSAALVVSLLAVLKAGGAYMPLAASEPQERLRRMAEDAGVLVVLTDRSSDAYVRASGVATFNVDVLAEASSRPAADAEGPPVDARHLAYVIHTSGSTGTPKAVAITHAALANLLSHMREALAIAPEDRWLAVTPITFDIAALELFLPLIVGAQVWLAPAGENGDGTALTRRLTESRATVMQATPLTWRLLIDAGWAGPRGFKALTGGEALPSALAAQLAARVGAAWNLYGPTETTIWSSAWIVDDQQPAVSLGQPIANTSLYILDEQLRPQPPGTPGELYIGGIGVARGYLSRTALTAERFVADPFARQPGKRMYRTGDWVRWVNGRAEFLGRTDHQIKVRGARVECGEIEHSLREHRSVRDVAVVPRGESATDVRLVAFLVRDRDDTVSGHDGLRTFLRERLPEHMIPSAFVDLRELPRTPHGKVDRRTLASMALPEPERATAHADPATPMEARVAAIWQAVLRVDRVGAEDDFLELGGESLAAVQCINRLRDAFGVQLPLIVFFSQTATVRHVAGLIEACREEEARAPAHYADEGS